MHWTYESLDRHLNEDEWHCSWSEGSQCHSREVQQPEAANRRRDHPPGEGQPPRDRPRAHHTNIAGKQNERDEADRCGQATDHAGYDEHGDNRDVGEGHREGECHGCDQHAIEGTGIADGF
jgi:hypothetical protein